MKHLLFAALVALVQPDAAAAQHTRPAPRTRTAATTPAQTPVEYAIAFPNAAHHEARVTATFRALPAGPLELRMSRGSPGRYALHEFAKNVYAVAAVDSRGRPLQVTRPNPHQWDVRGHDGTVTVTYTLFGDRADGTYAAIDRSHAHLNIPATFMWARGLDARPIRVAFAPADSSWRVATQLFPTRDRYTFTAPGLQYFLDSPTELSAHDLREWTEPWPHGGEPPVIRLAVHHLGTTQEVDQFEGMVRKVVREAIGVFGELPRFDNGSYTFIADYLPWASGDGMEHRNSTILSSTRPLATGAMANLGTVSHEFMHAWNVERIRPRTLEPFDFERENMSGELWLAEGFTQYYTPLLIARAGLTPLDDFARTMGGTVNAVTNAPGRRYFSPMEMSQQAPFVDAAVSIDPQNKANTFLSYYTWGAGVGLALDLELRQRGRTLDDVMRALWRAHGATERPYTLADVRTVFARVSGDQAFADRFVSRYITGREAPDYAALLAPAGLLVRVAAPGKAWVGDVPFRADSGRLLLASGTLVGTPLYDAGLDRGDQLVSLGGRSVATEAEVQAVLDGRRPGDAVPVVFESRGQRRDAMVRLAESPRLEVVTYEAAGRPVTDAMRRFREQWLGSRAPGAATP